MKLKPGTPEEAGMSPARVQHVKELARSWVDDGTHHALVVLVARRGLIVLHEAFGTLSPEPESPPLPLDAIFPLASATKPFTAAATMCLVEDGRVGLMRPVREYYPEISAEGTEEVLVHHLLTHLSGWRDLDAQPAVERLLQEGGLPAPEPDQHPFHAGLASLMRTLPLACGPGEAMQYCMINYELLADLPRRVSGTPIERFARERIFEPLGMADSSYVLPPEHRERKVRRGEGMPGSEALGSVIPSFDSESFEGTPSGGSGMHASARDIAVFAQMLLNGGTYDGQRVLSGASVQAMRRNQVPEGVPSIWERLGPDGKPMTPGLFAGGYGYGLFPFLDTVTPYFNGGLASPSSFSHSGYGGIYFWADPERDLVGVYLSVARRNLEDDLTADWRADIFVDAVTAAVED